MISIDADFREKSKRFWEKWEQKIAESTETKAEIEAMIKPKSAQLQKMIEDINVFYCKEIYSFFICVNSFKFNDKCS